MPFLSFFNETIIKLLLKKKTKTNKHLHWEKCLLVTCCLSVIITSFPLKQRQMFCLSKKSFELLPPSEFHSQLMSTEYILVPNIKHRFPYIFLTANRKKKKKSNFELLRHCALVNDYL